MERYNPINTTEKSNSPTILKEIYDIASISDPEKRRIQVNHFLDERLSKITYFQEKIFDNGIVTPNFIGPKTIISPSWLSISGYSFDDNEIYHYLFDQLALNAGKIQTDTSKIFIFSIFSAAYRYFGNILYTEEKMKKKRTNFR